MTNVSSFTRWRNDKMVNTSDGRLEVDDENFVLRFRQVGLKDLGPYSCQAYNGLGAPDSFTTVVKTMGPVAPSGDPNDRQYLQYVVDPPTAPGGQSYAPVMPPSGIYRSVRQFFIWAKRKPIVCFITSCTRQNYGGAHVLIR